MNELKNLNQDIKNWVKKKDLKYSYAERNSTISQNSFSRNKNDFRIFSKTNTVKESVDSRPHISVWLYQNEASIHFCVEDSTIISKLKRLPTLIGTGYSDKKRMHFKLSYPYGDVDISKSTYIQDIINQLDALYQNIYSFL